MAGIQGFRTDRVAQILMEEINQMIVLKKIKDPRISSRVSVLFVNVSKDIRSATVFISSFTDVAILKKSVDALNHAHGFIQGQIAKKYQWKHTPKIYFKLTEGLAHGENVLNILEATNNKNTENKEFQKDNE